MEHILASIVSALGGNSIFILVLICIMFDTFLGALRALKDHVFNSSFGIDGGIRKVCMIGCIMFLALTDMVVHINLLAFIPTDYLQVFGIDKVGIMEFFGILFVLYEAISVLKNMYLIGVPMPVWIKTKLENLLTNLTSEINEISDTRNQ